MSDSFFFPKGFAPFSRAHRRSASGYPSVQSGSKVVLVRSETELRKACLDFEKGDKIVLANDIVVTSTINIPKDRTYIDGNGSVLYAGAAGINLFRAGSPTVASDDVTLLGLTLDGNSDEGNYFANMIVSDTGQTPLRWIIRDCRFFLTDGLIDTGDYAFDSCQISGNLAATTKSGVTYFMDGAFDECFIFGNLFPSAGLRIVDGASATASNNIVVANNFKGESVHSSGSSGNNVFVANTSFSLAAAGSGDFYRTATDLDPLNS